jgi:uncharacterized membrane protein YraQ (UPF0718 family)
MIITDNALLYHKGQTISIKQYGISEAVAAFFLFGIPVLSALALIVVWFIYSPQTVESRNALLCCAAAFVIGFVPVKFVERFVSKYYSPVLLTPPPASSEMVVNG